jgi:hypothetical protein
MNCIGEFLGIFLTGEIADLFRQMISEAAVSDIIAKRNSSFSWRAEPPLAASVRRE